MSFKFLIDECLTPRLRQIALNAGYHETTSVRDRGLVGALDHDLMKVVIAEDFTLVTRNSVDFRGDGPVILGVITRKLPCTPAWSA
jgi:predicted nuclease of predicted toxin-antitoxin system